MCYFTVVSLILQGLFTLSNVTSHPNHHEIKMFPFNAIRDNDNIPAEKTACILIWYKRTVSHWKYSTTRSIAEHLSSNSPSRGGCRWLLVPSPSTPHLTEEGISSASHGAVHLLTAQAWCSGPQLSLLLTRGSLICLFSLCPYSQAEGNYRMSQNSFIRGWWQLFPPTLIIFKGKVGAVCSVVKRPVGEDEGNDLFDCESITAQSGQP